MREYYEGTYEATGNKAVLVCQEVDQVNYEYEAQFGTTKLVDNCGLF